MIDLHVLNNTHIPGVKFTWPCPKLKNPKENIEEKGFFW
jgi:hypothetical protein